MKVLMKFFIGLIFLSLAIFYSCDKDDTDAVDMIKNVESVKGKFVDKICFFVKEEKTEVDYKNNFVLKSTVTNGESKYLISGDNYYQIVKFDDRSSKYYNEDSRKDASGKYAFRLNDRTSDTWKVLGNAIVINLSAGLLKKDIIKDWHIKEITNVKLVLLWLNKENEFEQQFSILKLAANEEGVNNLEKLKKAGIMHTTQTYVLVTLDEVGDIVKQ